MKKLPNESWGAYEERRSRALRSEAAEQQRMRDYHARLVREAEEDTDKKQVRIEYEAAELSPVLKQALINSLHASVRRGFEDGQSRLYVTLFFDDEQIHETWCSL